MRLINPIQWGGLAALLAGVLLILSDLLRLYIDLVDPAREEGAISSIWEGKLLYS
jgi:hypothetical protein